ncbi:MAG: hypothetical protein J3K34DRAFT_102346 [Monoraphidium minutum]|nr:MAG: hypothetical protein J3K34DRAFT_102346 [Monoraphidium minutum]
MAGSMIGMCMLHGMACAWHVLCCSTVVTWTKGCCGPRTMLSRAGTSGSSRPRHKITHKGGGHIEYVVRWPQASL